MLPLIDKNVDKHGVRDVAQGFIEFLFTKDAQRAYAKYGLRPIDQDVAKEVQSQFPPVEDLWKIDYLGGWKKVSQDIYGQQGVYTKIFEELHVSK
jgi:sulfate/thiosulfate transport system substrate-binding protein